ncbi:LOW QUALITY PROTEIN: UDP-glycosyltransferase 74F2 [Eucalyptus grandis]|uniref:LOW QUALITY PROTEIN: UDP-glycosyltransferase 74F2 n=1 Tax=Eucalyptus grandis TaxID=71139 RepID=UPI00192EB1A4|nr:LOW QUALITY PROTEIN: UDP-glycosyltransferase 74F2 [Eucalyptus grandis]
MEPSDNPRLRPHVLVLPTPAQGHLNPMLQFSKRLVSRGLKATLALTVHFAASMHADPSLPVDIETISDGHDIGGFTEAESIEAYQVDLRVVGSRTLAKLIRKLDRSGRPIDAVIYDGFLPWALDVAKQCCKLGVVFFTQTCAVNNIYYHLQRGLLPLPLSGPSVEVPGLPPLEPSEMPSFVYKLGSYPAFCDMLVNQFTNVDGADFVLFDTFYELEKEVVDWMSANLWPLKTIGPTLPSLYLDKRLPDDTAYGINLFTPTTTSTVSAWLCSHPPRSVVYVSFGSMADLDPSQVVELAHGLALAGHPFLWIVRSSEQHKLPRDLMDSIPSEQALILPWCNQLEVLASDAIGCFVTHCGLNSVIEAICLGIPMVAMPQWTDQPTNAKFVEDVWRVGVRAKADEPGFVAREEVERRVTEVLGGGERGREMAESARKWMAAAKAAIGEGGSSDRNINEFVEELMSRALIE